MNGQQRELIRTSFEQVRQHKEEASELFYEHLFAGNPELLPMFKSASARSQVNKLMQVLEYAVDHLDHWPTFMSQAEELGARHVAYGVRPDHYAAVGVTLMTTLRAVLGNEFSDETEEAWMEFYTEISLVMERGGRG